ncbi:hypothetical protein C8J57DRAFT_1301601 [Mycena rebaudengoi]|nr:hypothetical protein C8J57DRAFT_1301601 [Mycena rebaudengoi]
MSIRRGDVGRVHNALHDDECPGRREAAPGRRGRWHGGRRRHRRRCARDGVHLRRRGLWLWRLLRVNFCVHFFYWHIIHLHVHVDVVNFLMIICDLHLILRDYNRILWRMRPLGLPVLSGGIALVCANEPEDAVAQRCTAATMARACRRSRCGWVGGRRGPRPRG